MSINAYKKMNDIDGSLDLTRRVLKSIELYIVDVQDDRLNEQTRREAAVAAITLTHELSNNIRSELAEEEQIIIIKVCGQIIKNINKYVRGEHSDLTKELAGVRLLHKLTS